MSEYELLLADPRVDPNLADVKGATPLWIAANKGRDRCDELLGRLDQVKSTKGPSSNSKIPPSINGLTAHLRGDTEVTAATTGEAGAQTQQSRALEEVDVLLPLPAPATELTPVSGNE